MEKYELTDMEILTLDGICESAKTQSMINTIKNRHELIASLPNLEPQYTSFISDVIDYAKNNGIIYYNSTKMRQCSVCKTDAGYALISRNTRYKKKGQMNFDKPQYIYGMQFSHNFINVIGYPSLSCCSECLKHIKSFLIKELEKVKAEIPSSLTGYDPHWKKCFNRKCMFCHWTGHEGELGLLSVILGGKYPGKCPSCGAENSPFITTIEKLESFQIIPYKVITN